jgi:hypothetical protein
MYQADSRFRPERLSRSRVVGREVGDMSQGFDSLHAEDIPIGFGLAARLQGIEVGEFWGSEDQVAIHFRQRRSPHGWHMSICWASRAGPDAGGNDRP